jgi:hypothetical protein
MGKMSKKVEDKECDIMSDFDTAMREYEDEKNSANKKVYDILSKRKADNLFEDLEQDCCSLYFIGYCDGNKYHDGVIINKSFHRKQKSDTRGFKYKYINQSTNGGYSGDDYAGTIAYEWEGKYLLFSYSM